MAPIEHCRFAYRCDQQWDSLEVIPNNPRVRFCSKCQSAVHWADGKQEFNKLARQGKCVAVADIDDSRTMGLPADPT